MAATTRPLLLCVGVLLCYGVSIFFNANSRISPQHTMLLLGSSRFLVLLSFLLLSGLRGTLRDLTLSFTRDSLQPFFVTCVGNAGMVCFAILSAMEVGEGGILTSMVSLYQTIPVLYGVVFSKEGVSLFKVTCIAASISATLILGLAPGADGTAPTLSGSSVWVKVFLLLGTCVCWGSMDILSAALGKTHTLNNVILLSALAQALTGSVASMVPDPSSLSSFNDQAKVLGGNALGVLGWLLFVMVGGSSAEVSSFVPLTSLYVFFPITVDILQGKPLTGLQWLGIVLAYSSAVGISFGMAKRPPSLTSAATDTAAAAAVNTTGVLSSPPATAAPLRSTHAGEVDMASIHLPSIPPTAEREVEMEEHIIGDMTPLSPKKRPAS
jgi:hypothetical protein